MRRTASKPDSTHALQEHLARLQQRQLEMVQQTTEELEALKVQLENSNQIEKLKAEVHRLHEERVLLEQHVQTLQQQLVTQQEAATKTIAGLTDVIQQHLKQVRGFAEHTGHYLEKLPTFTPVAPVAPAPVEPVKVTIAHKPDKPKILPLTKDHKTRRFSGKRFAMRSVAALLVIALGYLGLQKFKQAAGNTSSSGQVLGAATVATPSRPSNEYAQSFVDLPYSQTTWKTFSDPTFGISFDYPSNTANLVYTAGSTNVWILRKNGYLLKVSQIDDTDTLTDWWAHNQDTYSNDSEQAAQTTFKGLPALYVQSTAKTATSGSAYFVKTSNGIIEVWVKDEPPTTDDGQRITHMIDSLSFTS